jgi:hypothetical protein
MTNTDFEATRNQVVAVGVTSVELAPAAGPKERQVIVIGNTSTGGQNIAVVLSYVAGGEGQILAPGEKMVDSSGGGYICWQGNVSAISDAAGGTCRVFER